MKLDTLETVRRAEARHATAADSLLFNSAVFVADADRGCYVVEVRGHVVAEPRTLAGVKAFCAMHNRGIVEAMSAD